MGVHHQGRVGFSTQAKPNRMRWATYQRLLDQYDELNNRWGIGMMAMGASMAARDHTSAAMQPTGGLVCKRSNYRLICCCAAVGGFVPGRRLMHCSKLHPYSITLSA